MPFFGSVDYYWNEPGTLDFGLWTLDTEIGTLFSANLMRTKDKSKTAPKKETVFSKHTRKRTFIL
jgi:hypothetical protein